MIVPAVPESVATDGLMHTLMKLQGLKSSSFRILLTMVPPRPRTDGALLREELVRAELPIFSAEIPRLAAFEKAAAEGVPVYAVRDDRNAVRAWTAYEAAGQEIGL
jgi:chromosome partitioning protein